MGEVSAFVLAASQAAEEKRESSPTSSFPTARFRCAGHLPEVVLLVIGTFVVPPIFEGLAGT